MQDPLRGDCGAKFFRSPRGRKDKVFRALCVFHIEMPVDGSEFRQYFHAWFRYL